MREKMEKERVLSVDAVEAGGVLGKAGVTLRNWVPLWGLIAFQLCLARLPKEVGRSATRQKAVRQEVRAMNRDVASGDLSGGQVTAKMSRP